MAPLAPEARKLCDLRQVLDGREAKRVYRTVPRGALRMGESGAKLIAGSRYYTLTDEVRATLARLAQVPRRFFCEQCPPAVQAHLFNHFYTARVRARDRELPRELRLVAEEVADGVVTLALSDARLALLSAREVLDAVVDAAPPLVRPPEDTLWVDSLDLNGRVGIALASRAFRVEVGGVGSVVGGVEIHHDDQGGFATQLSCLVAVPGSGARFLVRVAGRVRRSWAASRRSKLDSVRRVAALAWGELVEVLGVVAGLARLRPADPGAELERVARRYHLQLGRRTLTGLKQQLGVDSRPVSLFDVLVALARLAAEARERPLVWQRRVMFACGEIVREHAGQAR